jgi:hypothetical protein
MPLAHAGHLLIDLPLFGLPVIVLIVALAASTVRSRRSQARSEPRRPSTPARREPDLKPR